MPYRIRMTVAQVVGLYEWTDDAPDAAPVLIDASENDPETLLVAQGDERAEILPNGATN